MAQDLFVGSSADGQIPKINTKQTVANALQKKSEVFEGSFSKLKPVHSICYGFSFCRDGRCSCTWILSSGFFT